MHKLIVDVPNLFWRVASAHSGAYTGSTEEKAGLALHSCLTTLNKYYKQLKPDSIAVVFEGGKNWRKSYTSSDKCVSKILYKGNRIKDPSMEHLFEVLQHFEKLVREHTSIICLQNDLVEGDDLIAGYVQHFSGDNITVLSGDKDFIQLLRHENVTLLNPDKGIPRTHENPEYFIFEKCIRGDKGDNVNSAYPNVRSKRLEKAFSDPYEMTLLMNEEWTKYNPTLDKEITYKVKDLFEENKLLMDLDCQPEDIKQTIKDTIIHGIENHGKFNLFQFNKFLGQHELNAIAKSPNSFIDMFSCTQLNKPDNKKSIIQF